MTNFAYSCLVSLVQHLEFFAVVPPQLAGLCVNCFQKCAFAASPLPIKFELVVLQWRLVKLYRRAPPHHHNNYFSPLPLAISGNCPHAA